MKTFSDCIPCLVRQTIDSLRETTDDEQIHETIIRDVLGELPRFDFRLSPAEMAQAIHRRIRAATGVADPHVGKKRRLNDMALRLYPIFARRVEQSDDPLELALRLSIAGNIMDLGVKSNLEEGEMIAAFDECLGLKLDAEAVAEFADSMGRAESILYLADNSGEIVFDRLLIEQMPREKITVAVRGFPIINDATMEDAEYVGLTQIVDVVGNGSDSPGTILGDCSDSFRKLFGRSDMIISKGQGNYETLAGCGRPIHFLLRVKCPVIGRDLNLPVGSFVLRRAS